MPINDTPQKHTRMLEFSAKNKIKREQKRYFFKEKYVHITFNFMVRERRLGGESLERERKGENVPEKKGQNESESDL